MKLICIRHGESDANVAGLCNADPAARVGLTDLGRRQAAQARERLRRLPIGRVHVSRLRRAQETAAILCGGHCADIRVDARLDDRASGYEGRPVADYLAAMRAAPDPFRWKAPGGESYLEMVARVRAFIADLLADPVDVALVVTHHEVLQAVAGHFGNLEPALMWRIWVDHCETLEFEVG